MPLTPGSNRGRSRLLAGSAALALLLATPHAHAQSAPVNATGDAVATNAQSTSNLVLATGDGSRANISVTGPTEAASVALRDNDIALTARGNDAAMLLAPSSTTRASRITTLGIDGAGVTGDANLLIANRQELRGGSAQADQFGAPFTVSLGSVAASGVALDDNVSNVAARGNALAATIDVEAPGGGGAGIVSAQSSGASAQPDGEYSGVAARVRSGSLLETGAVTGSRLSVSGNRGQADAASNAADNLLSAPLAAVPSDDSGPVMLAAPMPQDDGVAARFAILNRQEASNVVKARSGYLIDFVLDGGPAIRSTVGGDMTDSALASDGNALSASAKGNLASNRLTLSGNAGDTDGDTLGAIANRQLLTSGARIVATTHGGIGVDIAGALDGSTISAEGNSFTAEASGNVATGLIVIDGSVAGGVSPAIASSGMTSGSFTLDNRQDYGATSVTATPAGPTTRFTIGGAVDRSTLTASDNSATARATGDSAGNTVAIDGAAFGGSAALASRQSGTGNVTATLGASDDRAGMTIVAASPVRDSALAVTGNTLSALATGTIGVNTLDVTGAGLTGDGTGGAVGSQSGDFGATGTLALVNDQTIGGPGLPNPTPTIGATVRSKSGIDAPALTRSTLAITGNDQAATATANAGSNALSATGATIDGAELALSTTQYGQAAVTATSESLFAVPGTLDGGSVSILDNRNTATATINDVENKVALSTAGTGTGGHSAATAGTLGSASATGSIVLGNQQFATGSASASALSRIDGSGPSSLVDTRLTVDANVASADSAGNRALNALTVDRVTGVAGAVLASSQANMARIDAVATISGVELGTPAVSGSSFNLANNSAAAAARGNAAENHLALGTGTGTGPASVSAGRDAVDAAADAVLTSAQGNYGAVSARAGDAVALNTGPVSGSSLAIANNAMSAVAYGNIAANTIDVGPMATTGIALGNVQSNSGPVTATVEGAGYRELAGSLVNGTIGVTANRLSASAVGNQASSAIAPPR